MEQQIETTPTNTAPMPQASAPTSNETFFSDLPEGVSQTTAKEQPQDNTFGEFKGKETQNGQEKEKGIEAKNQKEGLLKTGKVYKVKAGDNDIELHDGVEFEVPVAGQPQKVPLKELLSNYSGKVRYDQKFSELDIERKSFYTEKEKVNSKVNAIAKLASEGNIRGAIMELAESLGQNPFTTWKQFRDDLVKQSGERMSLSPEEIQKMDLAEENEFLKLEATKRSARDQELAVKTEQEQAIAQAKSEVDALQKETGMDDATLLKTYDSLKEAGLQNPTIKDVKMAYVKELRTNQIDAALSKINAAHPKRDLIVKTLLGTLQDDLSWTESDIASLVSEALGATPENLANKIKQQSGPSGQTTSQLKTSQGRDALFFSDIE